MKTIKVLKPNWFDENRKVVPVGTVVDVEDKVAKTLFDLDIAEYATKVAPVKDEAAEKAKAENKPRGLPKTEKVDK